MRKLYGCLAAAMLAAAVIVLTWKPTPLPDRLVKDRAAHVLPGFSDTIRSEPAPVAAVLLRYAHAKDKVALYVAEASLLKYPTMAQTILPIYGNQDEFKAILTKFGSSIFPPIYYFMTNRVRSVEAMYYSARKMHEASAKLGSFFGFGTPDQDTDRSAITSRHSGRADSLRQVSHGAHIDQQRSAQSTAPLTPVLKGWFAINSIHQSGHNFLSQFALASDGRVKWIQSERILQGMNSFFAGGVRTLDTKFETGQKVNASDVGWAAADVIQAIGGIQLLRLGKTATKTAEATQAAPGISRSARTGQNTADAAKRVGASHIRTNAEAASDMTRTAKPPSRASRIVRGTAASGRATAKTIKYARYSKWPLIVVTGWVVLNDPSLISDFLAGLAQMLGLPSWPVQWIGWSILLLPLLYISSCMLKYLTGPCLFALNCLVKGTHKIERLIMKRRGERGNAGTSTPAR